MNKEELLFDDIVEEDVINESSIDAKMTDEMIFDKLINSEVNIEKVIPIPRVGVPFTLRGMSQNEITAIRKNCTTNKIKNGMKVENFNAELFNAKILQKGLVKPIITKEMLDKAKCSSVYTFLTRYLTPGEFEKIISTIIELSGYNEDFDEDLIRD